MKVLMVNSGKEMCGVRDYTRIVLKKLREMEPQSDFKELCFDSSKPLQSYLRVFSLSRASDVTHIQAETHLFDKLRGISFPVFLLLLWAYSKLFQKKVGITLHEIAPLPSLAWNPLRSMLQLAKGAYRLYFYGTIGLASDAIVVLSDGLKSTLSRSYLVPESKITVFPPSSSIAYAKPLDLDGFSKRYGLASSTVVSMPGFAIHSKGYHRMIQLMPRLARKIPNIKLFLTCGGSGSVNSTYVMQLKQQARALGAEGHIVFSGYLSEKELLELFKVSNAFVFPYDERTASSGIVSNVLSEGKPVITSTSSVFAKLVKKGIVAPVDFDDPESAAADIAALLASPKKRRSFIQNLAVYASSDPDRMSANAHLALWHGLLGA